MLFPALAPLLLASTLPLVQDWPQYRGPDGTGVAPAAEVPMQWSATENLAWKVALPGQGWSQPVVVGGTVYVTTAVGEGLEPVLGMEAGIADPRTNAAGKVPDVTLDWRVIALDLATGKERWSASAAKGKPQYPIHPSNTWASETPVAHAGGVVAFFGATGTLAAFDPAGKPLWKAELGAHPVANGFGTGASPAIHAGKVFVQCFNDDAAFLVAFDAKSGKELWRVQHPEPGTSWASPLTWHTGQRVELVASRDKLLTSHDPASGKELWRIVGVTGPSMCSFAADPERLYFGQRSPMGSPPLYALAAGGAGDLSPAKGSADVKGQAWAMKNASPSMSTPVAAEGLFYLVNENLLTCRDAASGEELYEERLEGLVTVAASPLVVGGHVLLLDEEGEAVLVPLGPEFEIAGRGKLDDLFWATPAVAGDALLLRGVAGLYCVRK
ncbi:MAG TPA: PQQ-binding-like beta-propeller repeat protein [Planctomycetota bacterium]